MKFNVKTEPVACPSINLSDEKEWTLRSFVFFAPSLVSELLISEIADDSQQVVQTISSDVSLLLKLQSGQKIDTAVAEELLNRMSSNLDDSLKSIFDRATDDEILASVRSKYIQTPAQLESYLKSLDSRLQEMSSQEIEEVINDPDAKPVSNSNSNSVAEPSSSE